VSPTAARRNCRGEPSVLDIPLRGGYGAPPLPIVIRGGHKEGRSPSCRTACRIGENRKPASSRVICAWGGSLQRESRDSRISPYLNFGAFAFLLFIRLLRFAVSLASRAFLRFHVIFVGDAITVTPYYFLKTETGKLAKMAILVNSPLPTRAKWLI
jgi:hypothetical protein